jgi:hypothetical protein
MQRIILLLSNISILDPQLSENLLNASRAYSIQLFSNNTPGMLLPPLPFFICHPTGHISNASASIIIIDLHFEKRPTGYLLPIFTGLKKTSVTLSTCHCCVNQGAAPVFCRPSELFKLMGNVLSDVGWYIAGYLGLA